MATTKDRSFLSAADAALLGERAKRLLAEHGVRIDHPGVRERLAAAGAQVDEDSKRVRLPAALVERSLEAAPRRVTLAGAAEEWDVAAPAEDSAFLARPGTGAPFYLDPDTGEKRRVTLADVGHWTRLADRLEGIDFVPFPSPSDTPPATADVHALAATLQNTRKHVWVQPYSAGSIEYLLRLAAATVGGLAELASRPRVSLITCSLTPLDFKFMDLEVIVQAAALGVPVHACSLPSAGTTAPVTEAGVALTAVAEVLVLLTVAQVLRPGLPVIATPLVFAADMATGGSLQSSVEAMRGKAVAVAVLKDVFGLPTHSYGWGTDAPAVEGQSVLESAVLAQTMLEAGCDILGGAGQVEVATAVSPVQLLVDEEVARTLRLTRRPVRVDEESLAWEELGAIEPGGHFLDVPHTLRHCRDAYRSQVLTRLGRAEWETGGGRDLFDRALATYRDVMARPPEALVDGDTADALGEIVAAADRELGGR